MKSGLDAMSLFLLDDLLIIVVNLLLVEHLIVISIKSFFMGHTIIVCQFFFLYLLLSKAPCVSISTTATSLPQGNLTSNTLDHINIPRKTSMIGFFRLRNSNFKANKRKNGDNFGIFIKKIDLKHSLWCFLERITQEKDPGLNDKYSFGQKGKDCIFRILYLSLTLKSCQAFLCSVHINNISFC